MKYVREVSMNQRTKELAEGLHAFTEDVIGFVERCSEKNWKKVCEKEEWTVGVTARHIGAGHFEAVGLARMMVNGEKLPEFTMEQLVEMANEHARQHAECTKAEVLEVLRRNGAALVDYVAGRSDAELDRTGHLALAGGELSAQQLIEAVILKSGGEHFANMKAAVES
jgi:DinB superfamily